jgi:hypothetical protein
MNIPDLNNASRRDLVREWQRVFRSREPQTAGAKVLRTCLLTHSQRSGHAQACNKAEAKLLSRLKRHEVGDGAVSTHVGLSPGTELVRSYRGQTYTVTVRDTGFEWNGAHYGSLSELATRITGTRRSGPKFFGLKS